MASQPGLTADVCELDYPPEVYGATLAEVEQTIQVVVERVFRDGDDMIRSGVHGRTMQPITLDDIDDGPFGVGYSSENHAMPNEYKPIFMNYENAGQTSGKYIRAMLRKHDVTGEPAPLDLARRTVRAIELFWNTVAEVNPYGRGWMPKPFGGIRDVQEMFECSPDQYADMTLGLDHFHRTAATAAERDIIERMVLSFADWWLAHDYTTTYQGTCCWWKRCHFPHSDGYFLYLNALAHSYRPDRKYADAFDLWFGLCPEGLLNMKGMNSSGLAIECLERLVALKPAHEPLWRRAARANLDNLVKLTARNEIPGVGGQWQFNAFCAHHLAMAVELFPEEGLRQKMQDLIASQTTRADFYHLTRGQRVDGIAPVYAVDGYRDMFWGESHVCWLDAYWALREPA